MARIHILDVTNRDGVQTARLSLAKFQKTMVNYYLSQMGVYQSEFGFPFLGNERNYLLANLELKEAGTFGAMRLGGWCRAVVQDVEQALALKVKDVNLSISTSDQMIAHKFMGRLDRSRVVKEMIDAVKLARSGRADTVGINAEDASRTDMNFLVEFALAGKEVGADRVRYCDTLGYDTPRTSYNRIKELAERTRMPVELHFHNDLGMAVANSIAGAQGAIDAGVDAYINTTLNGIGERSGQADLVSTLLAVIHGAGMADRYMLGDPIKMRLAWRIANYAAYAFEVPIAINQPGIGANAFTHESGIHADGALKDRQNYELYDYASIGRVDQECTSTGRVILTGEYGGLAGFKYVYQRLGVDFPDDETARQILELVQYTNAQTQRPLTDDELIFIASYPQQVKRLLTVTPLEGQEPQPVAQRPSPTLAGV